MLPRSKPDGAPATASPAPVLHAPRPRLPISSSHAKLAWVPSATGSPQLPASNRDDIAKQIRAKFENLVRASPLPKVAVIMCHLLGSAAACPLALDRHARKTLCRWLSSW